MKPQSIEELNKEIDAVLPELSAFLYDALPPDLRKVFTDYTFLTLFHAISPKTPRGIEEAVKSVRRAKRVMSTKKPVIWVGEPKPVGDDLAPFTGDLEPFDGDLQPFDGDLKPWEG